MYMNQCQKEIARLIDEYGCLTKQQLLPIVNAKLGTHIPNLDGYISQMCRFADYEEIPYSNDTILTEKGCGPDFDMIRSMEVMLCFLNKIILHRRGQSPVSIRLFINQEQQMKGISIIPVKIGEEWVVPAFSEHKYSRENGETVIFLLENREQIKLMHVNGRFAIIEKQGVVFFKK